MSASRLTARACATPFVYALLLGVAPMVISHRRGQLAVFASLRALSGCRPLESICLLSVEHPYPTCARVRRRAKKACVEVVACSIQKAEKNKDDLKQAGTRQPAETPQFFHTAPLLRLMFCRRLRITLSFSL
jgi:hypothetical protein